MAFSKDSPLGMDLARILLGFSFPSFAKSPVWTRHGNIPTQHRQGLVQQMLLCLHWPGKCRNAPKNLQQTPASAQAWIWHSQPQHSWLQDTAGHTWPCQCQAKPVAVAGAVSNPLWSSSLWLNLPRKRWWDNGRVCRHYPNYSLFSRSPGQTPGIFILFVLAEQLPPLSEQQELETAGIC